MNNTNNTNTNNNNTNINNNNNSRAIIGPDEFIEGGGGLGGGGSSDYTLNTTNSPIKFGANGVFPIYLGNTKVNEVYLGNTQLIGMTIFTGFITPGAVYDGTYYYGNASHTLPSGAVTTLEASVSCGAPTVYFTNVSGTSVAVTAGGSKGSKYSYTITCWYTCK